MNMLTEPEAREFSGQQWDALRSPCDCPLCTFPDEDRVTANPWAVVAAFLLPVVVSLFLVWLIA